ncbi:5913_t:CDS:2 [Diversispora eburnea]|uniref:5913_t:CDS:1 n=1 Tax=Diversispora eburnea TaxID=1213867 RepID=A0A9N9CHZ9_9GLOM|nr:5913_t:CDS:2 [Diversispora eburnea]
MSKLVESRDPGVILLVAGDGDYYPSLTRAVDRNWKIEVWFWSSDPAGKKYILEITDGETLIKWQDDEIMECFDSLELFGWWFREEGPTIYLYFDNKTHLKKAKNWLESKHPDVKVWEMPEKRKSWS